MRKRPPILVVPNIIRFLLRSFQATAGVLLLSAGLSAAEITPPQMAKEAAKLDQLISAILKKSEKSAPAPIDDATFLRRASLVAIGRIPTLAEIQKFNADPAPNKRKKLVNRLYHSKGYQSHMNNWFYDHLRLDEVKLQGGYFSSNAPLIKFTRQAVRENRSWKTVTKELLSTRGNGWTGSGASHYYTRDIGMPLDNSANTLRAFLGIRPVPRRPRLEMRAHRLLQSCRLHSRKKQPRPTRLPQRPRTLRQQVFRKGIQSPRPPPPSLLQRRHRPICRQRNRSRQRLRPHQAPR